MDGMKRGGGLVAITLLAAVLGGCGGGGSGGSAGPAPPPSSDNGSGGTPTSPPSTSPVEPGLAGIVMGGRQPIVDATVTVWAAATADASAMSLGQAHTDADGKFTLTLSPVPANGQIVYVDARGGDAGAGTNNAIALMTVAGPYCEGDGCGFSDNVSLNELTSAAAAYSLAAFIVPAASTVNVSGAAPGLPNAARTFAALVDVSSGKAIFQDASVCTGSGEPSNCTALRKLDTLANIAAACVNSDGAASAGCAGLLQQTQAADTLTALWHLATQPATRNDGAGVFGVGAPPPVFTPALSAAPADWSLALEHTGGGLDQPAGVAIDAAGNVWVANDKSPGSVTQLAPDGAALSPPTGFTGGGLDQSIGIAVDQDGNVWVANWAQAGGTSVTELAASGTPLSPDTGYTGGGISGPIAFAVTGTGTIWVANFGNSSLTLLDASGVPLKTVKGTGGLSFPVGIGSDNLGNVWVANQGNNVISEFYADGTPVTVSGYGHAVAWAGDLALGSDGKVWVTDYNAPGALVALIGGNTPPAACPAPPVSGDTGCPLGAGGFTGGGLQQPNRITVDGAGQVWVSNYLYHTVSEFDSDGAPLSPPGGYTSPGMSMPYGLAVDPSGNLWVANLDAGSVTEFIGIAAPVRTPRIGLPGAP